MKRYRFELYEILKNKRVNLLGDARAAGKELGSVGEESTISLSKNPLAWTRSEETSTAAPLKVEQDLRQLIKSLHGDEYDAGLVASGGQWLRLLLKTPGRCIVPYEKEMFYVRWVDGLFPPIYELTFGQRNPAEIKLEAVVVPLIGATYHCHGLAYQPTPVLLGVQPTASCEDMAEKAADHAPFLTGFITSGADTAGHGYGLKTELGMPLLSRYVGELAGEMDLPFIVDNRQGLPVIGTDVGQLGADVMLYSSPLPGFEFLVGRERVLTALRKRGQVVPHPDGLRTVLDQLQSLEKNPEQITDPLDDLYDLVVEHASTLPSRLAHGLSISKSRNYGAVEVNYEATWQNGQLGLPLFSSDDDVAGDNLLQAGLREMNIRPPSCSGGNLLLSPTPGERVREGGLNLGVKGLFKMLEILARYSDYRG